MTTKGRPYPTRIPCRFDGKDGQVVLDQLRTVDETRLVPRLGRIEDDVPEAVRTTLAETFAPRTVISFESPSPTSATR
jgi:mRNA interferase MazF